MNVFEKLLDSIRLALRDESARDATGRLKEMLALAGKENAAEALFAASEAALWEMQCGAPACVVYEFLAQVRKRQGDTAETERCRAMLKLYETMEANGVNTRDIRACRLHIERLDWEKHARTHDRLAFEKSVGYWRQLRLLTAIDPLLENFPDSEWLTAGDGRSAIEARHIASRGGRATPMDVTDAVLKTAKAEGLIETYRVGTVEALPFDDGAFDFVLAKDMLHHVACPWIGLHEMLRVARQGICFIEPYDHSFAHSLVSPVTKDWRTMPSPWHMFEDGVGNYVYSFSDREVAKFCMGLGLPFLACKGFADKYDPELDSREAVPELTRALEQALAAEEASAARGESGLALVAYVILKKPALSGLRNAFLKDGFIIADMPRNHCLEKSIEYFHS